MSETSLKIALRQGGGRFPGYKFGVLYFDVARKEATKFLDEAQYAHVVMLFKGLAGEPDPAHPLTVDVRAIENYYELRDKGGILGRIALRVYFHIDMTLRQVVVLGADKKEQEDQTSSAIKIKMRIRQRRYQNLGHTSVAKIARKPKGLGT